MEVSDVHTGKTPTHKMKVIVIPKGTQPIKTNTKSYNKKKTI